MRVKVTEQGLVIPKELLEGIQEVEIRREDQQIILVPMAEPEPMLLEPQLLPLPTLEGYVPQGWKDAIYE